MAEVIELLMIGGERLAPNERHRLWVELGRPVTISDTTVMTVCWVRDCSRRNNELAYTFASPGWEPETFFRPESVPLYLNTRVIIPRAVEWDADGHIYRVFLEISFAFPDASLPLFLAS